MAKNFLQTNLQIDILNNIIFNSIKKLINNSKNEKKLSKLDKKHSSKLHFIPKRYRIFGGILQSMNIQFGNFIEYLMKELVSYQSDRYSIIENLSGKKNNSFQISKNTESIIDNYITDSQNMEFDSSNLTNRFNNLKQSILNDSINTNNINNEMINIKHDIDLLFKDKLNNNTIYYIEIKYNDDHDTGKFVDINRKFIKTYAYLVREFQQDIKPILFYFTNKIMKGNIYIPENECIYRGNRFFNTFLNFDYYILENLLENYAESKENIQQFNDLYENIMNKYSA